MKQKVVLECAECGMRFSARIWTRLTIGKDKTTDDKIFRDEINFFICNRCGNEGFAWYPVKVVDKLTSEKAVVIPTTTEGFDVIEIGEEEPGKVFYDFDSLKWQIYRWQGGHKAVFDPPPEAEDIQEALTKGIIDEEEAEILRKTNWDLMLERVDDHNMEVHWTSKENRAFDLYMRCMGELELTRKVVEFKTK